MFEFINKLIHYSANNGKQIGLIIKKKIIILLNFIFFFLITYNYDQIITYLMIRDYFFFHLL